MVQRRLVGIRNLVMIFMGGALHGSIDNVLVGLERRSLGSIDLVDSDLFTLPQEQQRSATRVGRTVHFIGREQLDMNDFFSATWLQPLSTFLEMDVQGIKSVEDGCFEAFRKYHVPLPTARMTLDWLDFSVEHMSTWWKRIDIFGVDVIPFNKAVTSFETYVRNIKIDTEESPLKETFAVIAFQPYLNARIPDRARTLTIASMAATIASLMQVGCGRVVVVGYNHEDSVLAQDTFRFLLETVDSDANYSSTKENVTMIGPTEVGYVQVTKEETKSRYVKLNMPKGALNVLQLGFKGNLDKKRTKDLFGSTKDPFFWRYVFLTEPDTILQTRKWALPQLRAALDQGFILTPHRFQPLPHESDVIGMRGGEHQNFVPATGNFSTVINLEASDACCDEHKGTYKPGKDDFPGCGAFWWQCGFLVNETHTRLEPYSLIRFQSGTGIVSLAATVHGRRCFPNRNSACTPPGDSSLSPAHN